MARSAAATLCFWFLVAGVSPGARGAPAGDGPPSAGAAKLGLDEIVAGLEKAEGAWRSLKSWMLRYEDARDDFNLDLPIAYPPHEVVNARKGGWLFASWDRPADLGGAAGYYNYSHMWVLWRDGTYTQRLYDGVMTQGKDELLKSGTSSSLYQLWWYPNQLGVDIVSDAFPLAPASAEQAPADGAPKRAAPRESLARYLKSNRDSFRVRKDLELVDKVPCHVVEWPGREVIWVDPSRAMSVLRRTYLQGTEGEFAHEFKAFELRERSPGIWLPERQLSLTFSGGLGREGSRIHRVIAHVLKEARFNDLPDDFFSVPPPKPRPGRGGGAGAK